MNRVKQAPTLAPLDAAIEAAHAALWSRFVAAEGLIHDFVGARPSPEDCRLGRPNALGWWSPIENGPMFTGTYLPALCERARRTGDPVDREKARHLVKGLLRCATVSEVPGFIARGVGTDGRCHYPLGSQDQTHPWFYGLHAYATSDIPSASERQTVADAMATVAEALQAVAWQCPCDGAFSGQFRGDFRAFRHHGVAMYLFNLLATYAVTGDPVWMARYQQALSERAPTDGLSRLEICALGYPYDREMIPNIDEHLLWIYVASQGALARLAEMDPCEVAKTAYRAGLAANAAGGRAVIGAYREFDNTDTTVFGHANWQEVYPDWFPQTTQGDAERMASTGDREKLGQRKRYETRFMRNPLAAAAILAMAGDADQEAVSQTLCHYDYSRLHMAEFFFAECAYYAR